MRGMLRAWLRRTITYKWARRIVVAVIGGTITMIGIAMVVLPGPAIVVVPLGLGVLGLEFAWARHWLRKLRATASDVVNRVRGRPRAGARAAQQPAPPPREPGPPP
ncbi:MAG: PGPGW domain-containing protein [Gammaproteobacteria bacterium]